MGTQAVYSSSQAVPQRPDGATTRHSQPLSPSGQSVRQKAHPSQDTTVSPISSYTHQSATPIQRQTPSQSSPPEHHGGLPCLPTQSPHTACQNTTQGAATAVACQNHFATHPQPASQLMTRSLDQLRHTPPPSQPASQPRSQCVQQPVHQRPWMGQAHGPAALLWSLGGGLGCGHAWW
jgi:hypothetical protein